jgi:adenosylmethionine-8-amino-7-oxononanoate aminotransferase
MTRAGLLERDAARIWHPYTQHHVASPPVPVASASGAHLTTHDGRRILDCISSWWVTLHGHSHPAIARAIAEQAAELEQVIFAGFTHEPAVLLAESLVRVLPPGMSRVFYSDDGSTAVEVALKMAIQYWGNLGESRRFIVALANAYHGDTFGAMSVSSRGTFNDAFADKLFDVRRLPDPVDNDVVAAFDRMLDDRAKEIAAIIVEPLLLGAGGMRVWSAEQLRGLRESAASSGVLFIADEVLTGFGRTGPLFACEGAGISPDIVCLSKGLTGGFLPMGATVASERIFEAFLSEDRNLTLFHGHSYTANPIACAAAIASLALLDEESAQCRASIERIHRERLPDLSRTTAVDNARMIGTVAAFDVRGEPGYLSAAAARLAHACLERGILIRPLGNVVYLLPPYCIAPRELNHAYDVICEALVDCNR